MTKGFLPNQPQAKDISNITFVITVGLLQLETGRWVNRFALAEALGFPEKVVLAKARKLIRRGVLTGCVCGCRGDFEIPGLRQDDYILTR